MSLEKNKSSSSDLLITDTKEVAEHYIDDIVSFTEQPQKENLEVEQSPKPSDRKQKKFKKIWLLVPLLGVILAIGGVLFMRQGDNAEKTSTTAVEYSPFYYSVGYSLRFNWHYRRFSPAGDCFFFHSLYRHHCSGRDCCQ